MDEMNEDKTMKANGSGARLHTPTEGQVTKTAAESKLIVGTDGITGAVRRHTKYGS
jgi:2-polyprenyl-6-methoxyphenol hydroxylase-like FAD-dependent oxidoreductase